MARAIQRHDRRERGPRSRARRRRQNRQRVAAFLIDAPHIGHGFVSSADDDADPNQPIMDWKKNGVSKTTLNVVGGVRESNLMEIKNIDFTETGFHFHCFDAPGAKFYA